MNVDVRGATDDLAIPLALNYLYMTIMAAMAPATTKMLTSTAQTLRPKVHQPGSSFSPLGLAFCPIELTELPDACDVVIVTRDFRP